MQALEGLVEEEALGSYVLVEKEDVLDAIGTFVAAYLATVPEAQHMKPAELQQALTSTFRVSASRMHLNNLKAMPAWLCSHCLAAMFKTGAIYLIPNLHGLSFAARYGQSFHVYASSFVTYSCGADLTSFLCLLHIHLSVAPCCP